MNVSTEFWDGVLRRLGDDLSASALDAWVRPLGVERHGEGLRLLCATPFHRERVRQRFLPAIARRVEEQAGHCMAIELALAARTQPALRRRDPGDPSAAVDRPRGAVGVARRPAPTQAPLPYRFENFVVGPCNALAREACLALAHNRQRGLNPLYLSSEPGLGKTHLARAIVEEARRHGSRRAVYESAESFTNGFLSSIRSRSMERFKRRYREECDLLVIEDVQFLRAKSATQLELFHTLTHLVEAGVRVVLSGDRLPRDLEGFDARLRSQITAGLVAEIEPPDVTVRRNILRAKAAGGGVHLPEACLDLLVEGVRGSVRDLEGVLIQLVTSASLLKRRIDADLTRMALRKLAPCGETLRRLDTSTVIRVVAGFFGTSHQVMASKSRRRDELLPRQLAMYLCHRYSQESLSAIATAFGRNHPAVSNAIRVVERGILERAPLRYQVEELALRLERMRDA